MQPIFHEGRNCWRTEVADFASVIVDYGNYYRDLRESIIRARHSIFILGWDIDSRIELLRGKAARADDYPATFFELICRKAQENPDLQVYLNRWDYSLFFMSQREMLWDNKWNGCNLPNVHVCMDGVVPFSACHHQKIAVIDDEIAYWGGMDVALGRWDFRQHHVLNRHRADPAQLPSLGGKTSFDPYHDIQAVMAGPPVQAMAQWVRRRWRTACPSIDPVPVRPLAERHAVPAVWPSGSPPQFNKIGVALARTMPAMQGNPQIEEVIRLYLDEIGRAENFIYIENQFLTCREIAEALNRQLHDKPRLQILAVSCFNPNGIMERLAMWGGRVRFKDILTRHNTGHRVALAYPVCREQGKSAVVRIHSKIMIVDDRYLHIGSANLNDRSMGMDTEFDVSLYGEDAAARRTIAGVRNDLIHEHTGYQAEKIERIVKSGSVHDFLKECAGSRQHLCLIDDESYRDEPLAGVIYKIADPRRPLLPAYLTRFPRLHKKQAALIAAALALVACLSALWAYTPLAAYTDIDRLSGLMESMRNAPGTLIWVVGVYIVSGLLFFPVTAVSTAVVLIFGGVKGFVYATVGALASGLTGYALGRLIGRERLLRLFPKAERSVNKMRDSGVIGVTVIRMLPIAPFSVVNMIMGVIQVPILVFLLGTALGLSPGKIMLAIFGDRFIDAFQKPDAENILYAAVGIGLWAGVVIACNKLARYWQMRRGQQAA